jgi:hypothetical protein
MRVKGEKDCLLSVSIVYLGLFISSFFLSIALVRVGFVNLPRIFFSRLLMATTTTLTTLSSSKPDTKELCIICESQPYDLICTCGDKFDFNCIHQHVEQLGFEFHDQYEQVSEKLAQVNDLKEKERKDFDAARTLINDWVRIDSI